MLVNRFIGYTYDANKGRQTIRNTEIMCMVDADSRWTYARALSSSMAHNTSPMRSLQLCIILPGGASNIVQ